MISAIATELANTALPVMTSVTMKVSMLPVARQLMALAIERKCNSPPAMRAAALPGRRVKIRSHLRRPEGAVGSAAVVSTKPMPTVSKDSRSIKMKLPVSRLAA